MPLPITMSKYLPDTEELIIGGLGLFAALLLGGFALLLGGRTGGDKARRARHKQPPPSSGSVSPYHHQHIGASSPR